ncbi:type I restriction endonuclease [Thiolapillus sp.]|uniref:type I restriction endonuclease n=2 Tax=Thiolapillus sp. TaxID=2017437 RepID=UPI00273954DB|nr:type I restriction endonuclease [Thiolapillus sp.]
MNEEELENLCLDWFREGGWDVVYGPDIAPDGADPQRDDYAQVILKHDLEVAFTHINPQLPHECFEQVVSKLSQAESLDLITNNRAFHRLLLEGVPVEFKQDEEIHNDHAFLVDFEQLTNNRFVAINQFTVSGTKQPRRPDVICFINGLPFAVLELKSPSDENTDIWDAFNQLQTYKDESAICSSSMRRW